MGSKKSVRYLDEDVLVMAKQRIRHTLDIFDSIAVCFSGGKDSLTILHLVMEIYDELGIKDKIKVIFRDEELIPDSVLETVEKYRNHPQVDMAYYAVSLKSNKFILGKTYEYVQWDENREWIRNKPEHAITAPEGMVFDQYTMDEYSARGMKGKVAFITGVRADESITRFKACVNKKDENYINATKAKNVHLVKPVYDWSEKDVFKYFYDNEIEYCAVYDDQVWGKHPLRVATPLHAEGSKRLNLLKAMWPTFYSQLIKLFPEMIVQDRYWDEYDRYGQIDKYEKSWNGIAKYIIDNLSDPKQRQLAMKRVIECRTTRENKLKRGEGLHNYGGYPLLYVFKTIMNGGFKRSIMPCSKMGKKEQDYEDQAALNI